VLLANIFAICIHVYYPTKLYLGLSRFSTYKVEFEQFRTLVIAIIPS